MARITVGKIDKILIQSKNARTRMTSWAVELSGMTTNPKGGDMALTRTLDDAREKVIEAQALLKSAAIDLESVATVLSNRTKARA